ncbi:MAG: oxidoreductase [Rhodoglobus sp.]|nr:oxidoreductase [Rhodoglobus sp.]
MTALLTRDAAGLPAAPVRLVHLGLGAFHRAHQAWWTAAVDPDNEWGIAAFSGRNPGAAEVLARQDGLFTLVERGPQRDLPQVVPSIVQAIEGARVDRLAELVAAETTVAVTMTVTEAGYGLQPGSPLARLVAALRARYRAGGAPIAIVPCDNLPGNGAVVRAALLELADADLEQWIEGSVSFVSTSVDRITPRLADADLDIAERLGGLADRAPVITEPFRDWTLSGAFPAGRPPWELAGAKFVDDIAPYEKRKLWLLNGAHSLLAALGQLRGHELVAQAIIDPVCREGVIEFWAEARRAIDDESLGLDAYCAALLERFENPRIRHELAQIALDAETKLRLRIVPVARAERAAGRGADGCARAIAAWCALVGGRVEGLDRDLAADTGFMSTVSAELAVMQRSRA